MDITNIDINDFLEKEERMQLSKERSAEAEVFMKSCGKNALEIYRIEKFVPTPQAENTWGKFHTGDSYVICKKGDKEYDIHYWHGQECTTDEMGSSAAFTVQLSGYLNMNSNHHLEEQMYESDLFMSYFKKSGGVEYQPGGIESGFRDVTGPKEFNPRLLQVKGDRYPRIYEVEMKANSVNEGDVFILDMDVKIYFWAGDHCNVNEKCKALEFCNNLRKFERHCRAEIMYPKEESAVDAAFWAELGGKPATVNPPVPDDAAPDDDQTYSFYKISDETGSIQTTKIETRPLTVDMLDTNDCFVLELNKQVIIWVGRQAKDSEKKNALAIGKGFVKANNKPKGTRVMRIVEKAEDAYFKSFFNGFYPIATHDMGAAKGLANTQANQDISAVANKKKEAVKTLLNKLGKYEVKVYLCQDGKNVELPEEDHGHFYQDEVYAVDIKGQYHRYLIQWFGPRMASDKVSEYRDYLAQLTNYEFTPREVTRTSVKQGHEDDSFLTFFPSGFICHDGPYQTYKDRVASIASSAGCLYRVTGPFDQKPRAIQQDQIVATNLNSGDCFFVANEEAKTCFAWLGEGANADEKKYASSLAKILCPELTHADVEETKEDDAFWACFDGGKAEYSSMKTLGFSPGFQPRLFQISNATGYIHMREIYNFQQDDLNNMDVMVLDAFQTIYMWIGRGANKIEKKNAQKKVDAYIQALQDGRKDDDVGIVDVDPCGEPPSFTTHFPEWEEEVSAQWMAEDQFAAAQKKIKDESASDKAAVQQSAGDGDFKDPSFTKCTLDELKAGTPDGVNPSKKEYYLSEDDFKACFNMDYEAWEGLKDWKRKDFKKKSGLF